MKQKVIDPSEILVGKDGTVRNDTSKADPWTRFIARMFDYSVFFMALYGLHRLSPGPFPFGRFESWIPFEYLIWIPIEALLLWTWGKTPGKWLLNIELRQGNRARPEYQSGLSRSFMVWLRGLGMGIPFINMICLLVAYQRLKLLKLTSWDRDNHFQVFHRPVSKFRFWFAAAIAVFGLTFYFHAKNVEQKAILKPYMYTEKQ